MVVSSYISYTFSSIHLSNLLFFIVIVETVNNLNNKTYLEKSGLLPVLRQVLTDLLNEVESSGELKRYWEAVQ